MKKLLLGLMGSIVFNVAECQITKGNWMDGGSAHLTYTQFNSGASERNGSSLNIKIMPDIGYFFMDQWVGGVRLAYIRQSSKSGPPNYTSPKSTNFSIGPFVRYYFLPDDQSVNLLAEASYQYGIQKSVSDGPTRVISSNEFIFSAGPVLYFNTSIGIEFLLNYSLYKNNYGEGIINNTFGFGIGFQIHLERE